MQRGEETKKLPVKRTESEAVEDEEEEEAAAVELTHCKLIKWECSLLPGCLWFCSAALSKTALPLQSIAPSFHPNSRPGCCETATNHREQQQRHYQHCGAPLLPRRGQIFYLSSHSFLK